MQRRRMMKSICALLVIQVVNKSAGGFIISSPIRHPRSIHTSSFTLLARPKSGSVVESYQTVSVNCNSCRNRLFRYKKKNGTKSNLIKCYVERIVYDQNGSEEDDSLAQQLSNFEELSTANNNDHKWSCPNCGNNFGRSALIHGRPALKLIGGKTRMTKK